MCDSAKDPVCYMLSYMSPETDKMGGGVCVGSLHERCQRALAQDWKNRAELLFSTIQRSTTDN